MAVTKVGYATHQTTGTAAMTVSQPAGAADGDLMIMVYQGTSTITAVSTLSGWTLLVPYATVGTRNYCIQARVRQAGDPASFTFTYTGSGARSVVLASFRGSKTVADLVVGAVTKRAASAATCTAASVTAPANSMTLVVSGEATTAAESVGFIPTITNSFTHWYTLEQNGSSNIETVSLFTKDTSGTTGDATITYPNASANGFGVQIALPSAVAAPVTPVASFTASPTTITAGQQVQFTDTSTNVPTSWSWNFGAGGPSSVTTQSPLVTFPTAGTYAVALTATNSAGSNTSPTTTITVNPAVAAPVASFTTSATTITAGEAIQFTDTSTNTPTSWSWNFGAGGPATVTTQSPLVTFPTAGTYSVVLTATNAGGSDPSDSTTITVNAAAPGSVPIIGGWTSTQGMGASATATINPTAGVLSGGVQVDDWIICILEAGASYSAVRKPTMTGWTTIWALDGMSPTATGCFGVYARKRLAGDTTYTISQTTAESTATWARLIFVRGADDIANWAVGVFTPRATNATTTTAVAEAITTIRANSLGFAICGERTSSTTETVDQISVSNFTKSVFWNDGMDATTTVATKSLTATGNSGSVTFTFPNAHAQNGIAGILGIPPLGGTVVGRPKAYVGGSFQKKPGKVWNGTAWVEKPWKQWTGTQWKTVT